MDGQDLKAMRIRAGFTARDVGALIERQGPKATTLLRRPNKRRRAKTYDQSGICRIENGQRRMPSGFITAYKAALRTLRTARASGA